MTTTSRMLAIALLSSAFATVTQAQDLGRVHFATSCTPQAQEKFDRGLAMVHSFVYPDSVQTFTEAAAADPADGYGTATHSSIRPSWALATAERECAFSLQAITEFLDTLLDFFLARGTKILRSALRPGNADGFCRAFGTGSVKRETRKITGVLPGWWSSRGGESGVATSDGV